MLQFGKIEDSPKPKEESVKLNSNEKELIKEMAVIQRTIGDKYMPKSKMFYTGAAYPNWEIDRKRYEEIEYIKIVKKDKSKVDIIRNGRFVLKGTEVLNKYFD